jgi:regulator of nonsense transcripts 2
MPPKQEQDALIPEGSGGGKKTKKKKSNSTASVGVPPPLPLPKKTTETTGETMMMKNVSSNKQKQKKSTNATKSTVPPPKSKNITKKKVLAEEAISKPLSASEKLQLKEQIERDSFELKEKIRIESERKDNEEKEKLFLKKKKELDVRKQTRLKRQKLRTKNEEFDAVLKENDKGKEKEMENKLRQMDSAIKKNVALVKKLKTSAITEATSLTLKSDFESKINASKYMEECILAISTGKLKALDAFYAAEVIDSMFGQLFQKNQRTEMKEMLKKEILAIATPMSSAEAAQMALEIGLGVGLGLGIGGDSSIGGQGGEDLNNDDDDEENKPPTPLLRRAKLCLLAELYLISIIDSPKCVYEVVKKHAEMEYDVAPEAYLQSLSALAFFAKTYSLEFLGKEDVKLISINSTEGEEKEAKTDDNDVNDDEKKNSVVKCKPEVCEKFAQIIHEKYEKDALVKLAASVRLASAREEDVLRVLKTKGEVPAQVSSAFSKATATRDALLKQCQTLAEALRVDKIPKLEDFMDDDIDDKDKNKEANRIELDRGLKQRNAAAASEINSDVNASEWESDEQRRFYQDLLPIKESIPAVLLVEKPALENETDAEKKRREDQESKDFKVDALMNRLRRDCENAEKVDAFAVDFCYVATQGAKKRLAEELLSPPELTNMKNNNNNNNNNNAMTENSSNQQQNALLMSPLVPFYARVLKLMSKVFPKDISDVVASKVLEKFFNLNTTIQTTTTTPQPRSNVHSSSQTQQLLLKQKLQNVHYVSELIKFELIDPSAEAMQCLQILIENFERVNSLNAAQNGAVELMCAFVYRCGRFLCKSAKSKKRANTFLDIILRLKSIVSKYLDETQVALVDEAYYAARPREVFRTTKPPKPVLFEYVKYIFVEQMSADPSLAKRQLAKVLKHCDQFDDLHLERYLIRRAIKHSQQKFDDAERVVRLMSKLSQNQKDIKKNELIVKFTDAALEEFRFGLEQNLSHMTQRRVSNARVIGELFSQRCLHAESIFSCLFLLLNNLEPFNNDFDRNDPIRVRVANVLLEKCGRFFNRGWQKKKLDVFLTYFQRYMRSKTLSMDVNNDAVNIIKELRPQMKICESFQEAHEKCVKMEERFGVVSSSAVEGEKKGSGGLGTLAEDEEMEEEEGDDGDDTDDDDDDGESETLEDDYASSMSGASSSDESDDDEDEDEEEESDDDDDDESVSSSDDGNVSFSSSESSESSSSEEREVEVRMKTVVASRQEESEFEREMEKFLGVGSVKVNRNDENKQQTAAIPSGPNVGKSPPPAFAAQSIAFKMMRKGKDGKREKVDIALPETASFAMEAKKRQIMEAEELSEVRRLTLQRTADMQEEAISLEKQNKEGGINSMSWRKKKSSGDADQDGESKKDSFWNAHRRL